MPTDGSTIRNEDKKKAKERRDQTNKWRERERNLLVLIKALYDDYYRLYTTNNGLH
jgi:hypothetical protein